jgi:hypothetical protein
VFKVSLVAAGLLGAAFCSTAFAVPPGPHPGVPVGGDLLAHIRNNSGGGGGGFKLPPTNAPRPNIPPVASPTGTPGGGLKVPQVKFPPLGPVGTLPPLRPGTPPGGGKRPRGGPVVVIGGGGGYYGVCDAQADRCAGLFGVRTASYRRCMRRAGC